MEDDIAYEHWDVPLYMVVFVFIAFRRAWLGLVDGLAGAAACSNASRMANAT